MGETAAFRFYDNRQKYLLFVNTCSEKWETSERIGRELDQVRPKPPALRVFRKRARRRPSNGLREFPIGAAYRIMRAPRHTGRN